MIMLSTIIARVAATFAGHGLLFGLGAAALVMVVTWDRSRINAAKKEGAESVRVETRKANDAAVKTSDRIRSQSQSSRVRGNRDPNSID